MTHGSRGGRRRVLPVVRRALAAFVAVALGCDPGTAANALDGAAHAPTDTTSRTDATGMADAPADSLDIRLSVPDTVAAGVPVPMVLRVENISDRALTLYLVGRSITFDLIVERMDGAVVWRRLEGEVVPSILRLETLARGEALVLEDTWDQRSSSRAPVPPGTYRVRAEVPTEGEAMRSGVEVLRITGE